MDAPSIPWTWLLFHKNKRFRKQLIQIDPLYPYTLVGLQEPCETQVGVVYKILHTLLAIRHTSEKSGSEDHPLGGFWSQEWA